MIRFDYKNTVLNPVHSDFEFPGQGKDLKPLNFICGKNGSGKSAILAAIKLLFGSRTARQGKDQLAYIKHGEQQAILTLTLNNDCINAFEPQNYGGKIHIMISITKENIGDVVKPKTVYQVKAANGRVVAKTAAVLKKIRDHYNCLVDNPIVVLDQDCAKNFLSEFNPKKMYDLFEKTTQIDKFTDDIHLAKKQFADINKTMKDVNERREETKQNLEMWCERKLLNDKRGGFQMELKLLEVEELWAIVDAFDNEMLPYKKKIQDLEKKIERDTDLVENGEKILQELEDQIIVAEKEEDDLKNQKQEIEEDLNVAKESIQESIAEVKEAKKDVDKQKKIVQDLENKIKDKKKQLHKEQRDLAKDETSMKIFQLEDEKTKCEALHKKAETEYSNATQEIDMAKSTRDNHLEQKNHYGRLQQNMTNKIRQKTKEISDLSAEDPLDQKFGRNCQKLKNLIRANLNLFMVEPIGPIGNHIKIDQQQGKTWGPVIEQKIIGNSKLQQWIVSCREDKITLEKAATRVNFHLPTGIVTYPGFDKKRIDPIRNKLAQRANVMNIPGTIVPIDTLDIDHDVVFNHLLESTSLNCKGLLLPQKESHVQCIRKMDRSCKSLFLPDGQEFYYNRSNKAIDKRNLKVKFLAADLKLLRQRAIVEREAMEEDLNELKEKVKTVNKEFEKANKHHDDLKFIMKTKDKEIKIQFQKIHKLVEKILELEAKRPDNQMINRLQDHIENEKHKLDEAKNVLQEKEIVFEHQVEDMNGIKDTRINPLMKKKTSIAAKIKRKQDNIDQLKKNYKDTDKEMTKAEKNLEENSIKVKENEIMILNIENEKNDKAEQAAKIGARPEEVRELKEVQKRKKKMIKIMDQADMRLFGVKAEDILPNILKYQNEHKTFDKRFEDQDALKKCSINSINKRSEWLDNEKKLMAKKMINTFSDYLEASKYKGRLNLQLQKTKFDAKTGKSELIREGLLTITVRPPGKTSDTELKSLSGGERSFVTVCFICSLWTAMKTPFKFLDEFDVFMDVKHREMAVNLLYKLGSANDFGTKQIFLLTPNDIRSKEVIGNFDTDLCTIYSLKDPNRRQNN